MGSDVIWISEHTVTSPVYGALVKVRQMALSSGEAGESSPHVPDIPPMHTNRQRVIT